MSNPFFRTVEEYVRLGLATVSERLMGISIDEGRFFNIHRVQAHKRAVVHLSPKSACQALGDNCRGKHGKTFSILCFC